MSAAIPYLHSELLQPGLIEPAVYENLEDHYWWSDDWSADFYVELARKGFITICSPGNGGHVLLPEMQKAYAVLDWPHIRMGRSTRQAIRRLAASPLGAGLQITITSRVSPVIQGIRSSYAQQCWLAPPYAKLLLELEAAPPAGFQLWAVELRGTNSILYGGELGYTIGTVYTSLSGFLDRSRPEASNLGKVQLYALAGLLKQQGYTFWNLGHPYMQYKLDLGAHVLHRLDFLARWLPAAEDSPARPGLEGLAEQSMPALALLAQTLEA